MSEEMPERTANVAEFKVMKDDSKPFLGNGGSVGKHDTYPPSLDFAYADEERLPPAERATIGENCFVHALISPLWDYVNSLTRRRNVLLLVCTA